MDFGFSEEQVLLKDSVRRLMERHAPTEYVRRLDREGAYPFELHRAWVEAGLIALPFPEDVGGLGGSIVDLVLVAEEISRTSADFFMAFGGGVFCGLNIARKGDAAQKSRWLPPLLAGDIRMAIALSEPNAGSDLGAMSTTGRVEGGDLVINGRKVWITGAGAPDTLLNVYLKSDTTVPYRKGMSLALVENDAPGVECRKLDMLGRRCTGTYEVTFDDVRVPLDRVIGGLGGGWDCMMSGLQAERITSAAGNLGASQAALDMAVQFAGERSQFGRPIGTNQAIAHLLADLATEIEAGRALTWLAAWKLSAGQDALREITMAKLHTSEAYVKVANAGMQVMGASGYSMEFDMQRHYRDARSATIAAGSSQMQRNLIAGLMGLKVA